MKKGEKDPVTRRKIGDEEGDWADGDEEEGLLARAKIRGGPLAPQISGRVLFEEFADGTCVTVEICGLPAYQPGKNSRQPVGPHGFHLHENGTCEIGDPENPFLAAGSHWNPGHQPHGNQAGDFPVLFSNHGRALMIFYTDKFRVEDVIGKTVIIHENPDDYRTQPAGNAGKRLACGVIRAC